VAEETVSSTAGNAASFGSIVVEGGVPRCKAPPSFAGDVEEHAEAALSSSLPTAT
jgi:hypothetical protein